MRNLQSPGRSPVHAPTGMASTSHPLATETAVSILKDGGNALDAAIAACAVQCVVEPGSTGIGGDNFCLYSPQGGDNIVAFNGSGKAPAAAHIEWYQAQGIHAFERSSPHSVTIPSAIDAWWRLWQNHGKIPFSVLLQPAIHYARDGYPVASRVHCNFVENKALIAKEPSMAAIFLDKNGNVPGVGQRHYQPALADTLEAVACEGRDVFYKDEIAQHMVSYLREKGGLHTMEDFAATEGIFVTPIATEYRGLQIYECPPNGQGVIALLLLNVMKKYGIDPNGPITAERIHLEIEVCRQAYRARNLYVADPDFDSVPVQEILSDEYAENICNAIDLEKAQEPPHPTSLPSHHDTVYITVVDKDRNACSFINTLFMGFGSGLADPKTGVVFHNRGVCFSLDPSHPNCIAGNKRPMHTIIPAMATKNGKTVMSFGVMGGHYQAFGHMQFLTRFLDFEMDIQEAMDAPRFMVDPETGVVEMETTVSKDILDNLVSRGHRIVPALSPVGGSQAIWIDWENDVLTAGSDPRKDGCAIGF